MTEATETTTKTDDKSGVTDLGTVEERAQRMGWTPKEKFRGDEAKWVDAATFVKNGEESLPILRERLRSAERSNIELGKTVQDFKKMSETAWERAYEKAKKELKAEIKTAGKEGDEKAVDAATDELAKLEREKVERTAAGDKDPVFDGWKAQNQWYEDRELAIEAEGEALKLRKSGDTSNGVEFLEKVKERVKKIHPDKFGNPRRANGSSVERPSAGGEGATTGKGWDSLPAEAKASGERFIKQKLYKDKAAYAAAYHSQN